MYGIIKTAYQASDRVNHYVCESYEDILSLPVNAPFGSDCYVLDEEKTLYMTTQWELTKTTVAMPLPDTYPSEILGGTEIALTCETTGATIYYTVDGTTPTSASTAYTAAIEVTADTVIKAIAYVDSATSLVMTAAYTIPVTKTPSIMPAAGEYLIGQELTMTCPQADAAIYYTTNGDTPTSGSTEYDPDNKPALAAAGTIKAIAIATGHAASAVCSVAYTVSKAATPVITPAAGAHPKTTEVTMTCATVGADIYYTTNGDAPTSTASATNFKYNPAAKPTITAAATFKAKAFKSTHADSDQAANAYTISVAATPVAAPVAGAVADNSEVVLTCATEGTAIYYTVDGSTPDATKTLYTVPIVITDPVTIKAIAIHANYTNSSVLTAAYTIA